MTYILKAKYFLITTITYTLTVSVAVGFIPNKSNQLNMVGPPQRPLRGWSLLDRGCNGGSARTIQFRRTGN